MKDGQSLSHTTWDCKYHLVWIPKCRKEALYGNLRKQLGDIFKELALQKESKVIEGHLIKDHVHMLISIRSFATSFNVTTSLIFMLYVSLSTLQEK